MSNCSNHRKDVHGETDMKHLAEEIGNLHYESLSILLYHLSKKMDSDSQKDYKAGRKKIALLLEYVGVSLFEASTRMERVWKICEPKMTK